MGLYDLRCALSGLSLSGRMGPGSFRTAVLLVGEEDGRWAPLLPPVSGHYDRYGRVEMWGEGPAEAVVAAWVGVVLGLLTEAGVLQNDAPERLAQLHARGDFGDGPGPLLALVAESVHREARVTIGATRVRPCFYREDVADEISADPSLAGVPAARLPLLDAFAPWPPEVEAALVRLGRVLAWAERHGGLRPVGSDEGHQHDDEDFDQFAREAYARDPILRRMLARWHRHDMEALDLWREIQTSPARSPALRFEPAMIDPVLRGRGVAPTERAALAAALASAGDPARVGRLLAAAPSSSPAVLAEFDGRVELRGGRIHLHHAEVNELVATYVPGELPLRVEDGARVVAGTPLTTGEADAHDLLRIFGAEYVAATLSEELGELLGLPRERARTLVEPMLQHVRVVETGTLVSMARWEEWFAENEPREMCGELALTGYPTLLTHVDPTLASVEAARDRRLRLMNQLEDPDRYHLPRDLVEP